MTARQLIDHQIEDAGFQLRMTLEGLSEDHASAKLLAETKSPVEQLAHLEEVYVATLKASKGEEHAWGTYEAKPGTLEELTARIFALRAEAIAAFPGDDEQTLKTLAGYIVGHDYYHVGQLVALRVNVDEAWNFMSLYRH